MKFLFILLFNIFLFGCSQSDTTQPAEPDPDLGEPDANPDDLTVNTNKLVGRWISNCYEDIGDFGISLGYKINESEFTENGVYTSNSTGYTDFDCTTPDGSTQSFDATYIPGDSTIATDGNWVRLMTVQQIVFSPETIYVYDLAYRIAGDELNFDLRPGPTPTLDYTITYVKQ